MPPKKPTPEQQARMRAIHLLQDAWLQVAQVLFERIAAAVELTADQRAAFERAMLRPNDFVVEERTDAAAA